MKRFWTAFAVTVVGIVVVAGCNDYGNTFQNPTGAALVSLSPARIPAGGQAFTILMNGAGFVKQTLVQWNGKTCPTTGGTSGCNTVVTLDANNNVTAVSPPVAAPLVSTPRPPSPHSINP